MKEDKEHKVQLLQCEENTKKVHGDSNQYKTKQNKRKKKKRRKEEKKEKKKEKRNEKEGINRSAQGMAKEYLEKARSMLDEKKPIEAMCLLQCALELDDSEEMKRIGEETKEEIKEYAKILAAQHKRMDVRSKQGE